MKQIFEFDAQIKQAADTAGAYAEIPSEVREAFGKGRVPVSVSFDGETYDAYIQKTGTQSFIVRVRRDILAKTAKQTGDTVRITVRERDKATEKISTAEEYIAQFPEDRQEIMKIIRETIKENIPGAEEKISWGMPSYYLERFSAGFACAKNHIGFYPGAEPVKEFAHRLEEFETSRGTVRFPFSKPVPYELIGEICRWIYENSAKKEDG